MFKLKIHKSVTKFLSSRSSSEKNLIKIKLDLLKDDPYFHPKLDIKKMKGFENVFRLRVGKTRMIYQILNNELLILVISAGTRGDIYKKKK